MSKKQYWFKRKRYGWGWVPATWQGWVLIAVYVSVVIAAAQMVQDTDGAVLSWERGVYALILVLATTALVRISYKTGPRPKWRWGKQPDDIPGEDY